MRFLTTRPDHERFVDLAGELADEFQGKAEEHDRAGTFPHENFKRLQESGYLRLMVPEELGGLGADLSGMVAAQERLARGCASTALTVNMHLSMSGQIARRWRSGDDQARGMLHEIVEGRAVLMGATAEPGHALVRSTGAKARRVDGGYRVTGKKVFGTGSVVATHMMSMAVYDEHPDGPRILVFRVRSDTPGVRVLDGTWNTSALRATQSENVELRDVLVSDEDITLSFPVGSLDGTLLQTLWGWAMPTFSAVYLGVAVGAYEQCLRDMDRRGWSSRAHVRSVVNECEALIESSRALIERTAREVMRNDLWTTLSVQEGTARVVLAKTVCTNNAVQVVDRVIGLVGTQALRPGSVYERAQRDVRAGTMHPYSNIDACDLVASTAFGTEEAPVNPPRVDHLAES